MASPVPNGAVNLDRYATAERSSAGYAVTLTDGPVTLVLTASTAVAGATSPNRWMILPTTRPATGPVMVPGIGTPVVLPEPLLARANRLMQGEGVTLQRDWRTKTHVLRAAPHRVLPLQWGMIIAAVLTTDGWRAYPSSAAPTPSAAPSPAVASPAAPPDPTPDPEPQPAPDPVQPAPGAQRGKHNPSMGQAIPAAYRGKVVLSAQARKKWRMARAAKRAGEPAVIAMVGPSGAGKTHAVHALAAEEGLDVVKFDASGVVEPSDWFGTVTLDGQGTRFVPSDLLTAITMPGARVLLLDEVNRANLRALNAMLPLLDGSGSVTIPQSGKRERVNPDVQIVVTANIGSAFLGVEPLDEAIRTRVSAWIEIDHLTEPEEGKLLLARVSGLAEHDARNLARLGALVRESAKTGQHPAVSTRQLLSAAWMIALGGDARLAVDAAVLDGYDAEGDAQSARAKVRTHVAGITWTAPKPSVPGEPGAVYTGTTDSGVCHCGHEASRHGIGTAVSTSTHCRTCAAMHPGVSSRQCGAYNPVTQPA
jgi:hypothetical protein